MPSNRPRLSQPHRPATAAELDALSTITPLDVQRAAGVWERDAPLVFRQLLNATEEPPERRRRGRDK